MLQDRLAQEGGADVQINGCGTKQAWCASFGNLIIVRSIVVHVEVFSLQKLASEAAPVTGHDRR